MADNTTITAAKNGDVVFHKCLNAIKESAVGGVKASMWVCSGVPTVDGGSQATYPLSLGDLVYDYTNSNPYVVTVAPAAATNATLVKMVP